MNILVTGTEGYLGCLLAGVLLREGHEVVGVDTGYFRTGWLYNGVDRAPRTLLKDLRTIDADDLQGIDAIVHMAELSNDPMGQLAPDITYEVNHKGTVRLANLARENGVRRFVYMSSCSVYGVATQPTVDETSDINPQTAYAECKALVERDLGPMAGDDFVPTFMRNATAFGASPRQRFDLVLNNLMGLAWTTREIAMISDGSPWRPLVHALDIAKAITCVLRAPEDDVRGQIFNVGSNEQNYQVKDVAQIVAEQVPGCDLSFGDGTDNRSYRVNFDKIHTALPDFSCEWDARRGAAQLAQVFERIGLDKEMFEQRPFTRLKQLEWLLGTGQLDADFFWRPLPVIFTETALKGAWIVDIEPRHDDRGFFARTYCREEFEAHGIELEVVQANTSYNERAGTLRGMHFQYPPVTEAKFVRCPVGALYDVIVDLRPESPTFGEHVGVELSQENQRALYVPQRFGHGFLTLTDGAVASYQVGEFYSPGHEGGLRWDDPELGIDWPMTPTEISDKDANWPDLAEVRPELERRMAVMRSNA